MISRSIASVFFLAFIAGNYEAFGQISDQGVHPTDALPRIPVPSGPFGIGRAGYNWVDPSRPDQYSTEPNGHRELMVYFWYPTSANSADAKGPYLPGAQGMNALPEVQGRMRREFGSRWPAIVSGTIFSHAVERAPVAKSAQRFPVIVFSHGLGSTGFNYTCLIEDLVSHGYVVASIEHTYIALAVRFPDGRVVPRHNDSPPAGLSPEQRTKWVRAHISEEISDGAADVRFVLDRMTAANGDAQQFQLAGSVDLNRVAAMGHSAGAEFAARACQKDARFKACVDLDGGMVPMAALPEYPDGATLKQPLLFLEAFHPESQMAGTPAEHAEYFKKKEEQLQTTRPGSYDVVLRSTGIAHPSFSDIPLLFAGQDGYPQTAIVLHNLDLIEKYVCEFLDKNLNRGKAPLLDSVKASVPEATVQRYGH
jgi:pimeloyl-ACP methyl ester carboxylesterase